MKVCPDCGYSNPDGWTRCEICGRDVTSVAVTVRKTGQAKQEAKSGKRLYWVIGAVLVFAAAGIVTYKAWPKHKTPEKVQYTEEDDDTSPQIAMLKSLAGLKAPSKDEVGTIKSALKDEDSDVRLEAVSVLGVWLEGGADVPGALDTLIDALRDENSGVRAQAAMRVSTAIDAERDSGVLSDAGAAKLGIRLRPLISDMLAQPFEQARQAAAFLAGATKDLYWQKPLENMLTGERDELVKIAAAASLMDLEVPAGRRYLLQKAKDPDAETRAAALEYLDPDADYYAAPKRIPPAKAKDERRPAAQTAKAAGK